MITKNNGYKRLSIFWKFKVDKTLPKYQKKEKEENSGDTESNPWGVSVGGFNEGSISDASGNSVVWNNSPMDDIKVQKIGLIRWIFSYFDKRMKEKEKAKLIKEGKLKKEQNLITIKEFFLSFTESFKELTPVAEIAEHYENAITKAKLTGQVALIEKMENILDVSRSEAHLIQLNLKQYVNEAQVMDFYESVDSDKNLKLTWIKNFAKIIPDDIIKQKEMLDARMLFDNYVILHYDPNNDATTLTEVEKEVKKDPIIFGLIQNSDKLYYVADWKDDYCDLTLEDMFNELGEKVLTINNKTVKTFIDRNGEFKQKRKKIKS